MLVSTPHLDYPCSSLPSSAQTCRRHSRVMTVARAWSCASRTSWVITVAQTDYILSSGYDRGFPESLNAQWFQTCTHTSYAYDNWQLRGSHGFNLRKLPSSPSGQDSHNRLTILAISTMSRSNDSSSGLNSPSRLTLLAISTMSRRNPHTLHPQRSPRLESCTSGYGRGY